MTNLVRQRRQSETSKILNNLQNKNQQIVVSANEEINKILNNDFAQKKQLAEARRRNQEAINKLNNDYVRATQDVLSDDALQFLVQHSQIDAPTLTSIFAGFELARASKARKLNEQRQLEIEGIRQLDNINQQVSEAATNLAEQQLATVARNQQQEIRSNERASDALLRAAQGDIQAGERRQEIVENRAIRRTERAEDAELQRDLQNIRSGSRSQRNNQLELFRRLQSPTGVSDQSTVEAASGGNTNPLLSAPVSTSPAPIPQSVVQPSSDQRGFELDSESELSDQEILLLNHDRDVIAATDPTNIFTAPLSIGNTVNNLSEAERNFLATIRDSGGAELAIQQLNQTQGFSIGQEQDLLTDAERSLLNLNRISNNIDDTGDAQLINEFGDLTSEEQELIEQFRESDTISDQLGDEEFDALVEFRTGRDGEVIPIGRSFSELDENDQNFVNRRRLDQLDFPTTPPPQITTNSESADDTLLLAPEVIEQIDLLNQREEVNTVDPLTLQQSLIDDGIDVANLTVEEFNRVIEERGL